jgi:hypothetical protein
MVQELGTSEIGRWLATPGRPGTGPLIEVDRRRATQGIDVVGAPAYDPEQTPRWRQGSSAATPDRLRPAIWVDSTCCRASTSQSGRYTRRLRPTGMLNVSTSSRPRHWRTGR